MKGFALRLVLKQRYKRTRKWPIGLEQRELGRIKMECAEVDWRGVYSEVKWREVEWRKAEMRQSGEDWSKRK